jgi:hypothetical protein
MSKPAARDRDDEEIDQELTLPPLDADEGDDPVLNEGDMLLAVEEGGGLDDSTAADLDVGDELGDLDGEEGGDTEGDVDVGPLDEGIDIDGAESSLGADEESGADDEGVDIDESLDDDDGGAEGTSEAPEDDVDEDDLPDLDDGEDTSSDQALAEELLAEGEGGLPPWAPARVVVVEGAGAAVPCRKVTVAGGRVAAAGEVLLFVEEGARAARQLPFGENVVAVALGDDALLAATARGQLLSGRDQGAEAASLGSWRPGAGAPHVDLAATPGRFWVHAGTALSCATLPGAPAAVRDRGVLAIAASGGTLVAVTLGPAGAAVERFRGDDEGGMEAPLAGAASALVERSREAGSALFAAAAGGRCLALSDGESVLVSRDGGATFASVDPGPAAALAFAGEDASASLLVLVVPAPSGASPAYLVEVSAAGEAARIGELSGVELPAALAWDASREVIWVASGAGLAALGTPRRH